MSKPGRFMLFLALAGLSPAAPCAEEGSPSALGTVTASVLRVRAEPALKGAPLGKLEKGQRAPVIGYGGLDTIDGIRDRWVRIRKDGLTGWVFGGYLDVVDAAKKRDFVELNLQYQNAGWPKGAYGIARRALPPQQHLSLLRLPSCQVKADSDFLIEDETHTFPGSAVKNVNCSFPESWSGLAVADERVFDHAELLRWSPPPAEAARLDELVKSRLAENFARRLSGGHDGENPASRAPVFFHKAPLPGGDAVLITYEVPATVVLVKGADVKDLLEGSVNQCVAQTHLMRLNGTHFARLTVCTCETDACESAFFPIP